MLFLLSLVVRVPARLLVLSGADEATKDLEILVLRQQLRVLRRQARRPRFTALDRVLLAAASRALPSSTPLGGCGCWLQPAHRPWESAQAHRARAGPTRQQELQLTQCLEGGQADARTFGSSRCSVTKACATETRVTWWC